MGNARLPRFDASRESERLALEDMHRGGSLAWDELTHGHGAAFAQALNTGLSNVNKMGEPHAPNRPPNLQLAYAMLRGLELLLPEERVLAPLQWLNSTFRQLCYTAPVAEGLRAAAMNLLLTQSVKEFSEWAGLVSEELARPEGPQGPSLPKMKRELDQMVRVALELQANVDQLCTAQRLAGAKLVGPTSNGNGAGEAGR
jgi:hypothetical protein